MSVTCPPSLVDYQELMKGVDHVDQMMGYYNIDRRSVKWWNRGYSSKRCKTVCQLIAGRQSHN